MKSNTLRYSPNHLYKHFKYTIIGETLTKKNIYHSVTEWVLKPMKRNMYFIENNIQNIIHLERKTQDICKNERFLDCGGGVQNNQGYIVR